MIDDWKITMTLTLGNAVMAAKFPTAREAQILLINWVESEAEACLDGTVEERFAEAKRWIEGLGGILEISEDAA